MDRMAARSRNIGASVAALLAVLAVGAVGLPAPGAAKHEAVGPVRPSLEQSATIGSLTVMSYNVEGLPPPARFGRSASLERIGGGLAALRREGREPNVVLLQESFAAEAKRIGEVGGYRYVAAGPSAEDLNSQPDPAAASIFVSGASHLKGEDDGKWLDSGLRILSDYPIVRIDRLAFPAWSCAGYDCLANKGAVIAWIRLPGVAQPVAFIDTHLNSRAASGVSKERADVAYAYQVAALRQFIHREVPPGSVAFLGGDFNSGKAAARRADLRPGLLTGGRNSLLDALAARTTPDMRSILQRGKDWLFYRGSSRAAVTLTGFDVPFGQAADGSSLSDHLGYEARYKFGSPPV